MLIANVRLGSILSNSTIGNIEDTIKSSMCYPSIKIEGFLILLQNGIAVAINIMLIILILSRRRLRKWSFGLIIHQALLDGLKAFILIPIGLSILKCYGLHKCLLFETSFLILVTLSVINFLAIVLSDSPIFPYKDEDIIENNISSFEVNDSQCIFFAIFMIWFTSMTLNLGPTLLSGRLSSNQNNNQYLTMCRLIKLPQRHYVPNVVWTLYNTICIILILFYLRRLYNELTNINFETLRMTSLLATMIDLPRQEDNSQIDFPNNLQRHFNNYFHDIKSGVMKRIRMYTIITFAYIITFLPLFLIILIHSSSVDSKLGFEICLHISYLHSLINPVLFITFDERILTELYLLRSTFKKRLSYDIEMIPPPPRPPSLPVLNSDIHISPPNEFSTSSNDNENYEMVTRNVVRNNEFN